MATEEPIVICPNCKEFIIIEKINCAIFRHGIIKYTGQQIYPHATKELCDYYIRDNKIYGCGKPFQIILVNNVFEAITCEYK